MTFTASQTATKIWRRGALASRRHPALQLMRQPHFSKSELTQGHTAINTLSGGTRGPLRPVRGERVSHLFCLLLVLGFSLGARAENETAESRGLGVATAADHADSGFLDSTADLTMVMQANSAREIRREMRQLTLEVEQDGDKSIIVFDRPRDLKGTAILTHTHRSGQDDQWLYLPALKRVKRISSSDKSGPFMGSEFAYEDLASQEVEKYSYRFLKQEHLDEQLCNVIERIPVDRKSGYTRQIAWYDTTHHRLQQVEYYDRKDSLLKTMTMVNYQQYQDQFWRPDEMHMTNHQTGKSTILIFENYRLGVGLKPSDFSRNALSRMR